jgi:hypothetical protein
MTSQDYCVLFWAGLLCTILGQGRVSLGGQCRLPAGYRVRYIGYSSKSLYGTSGYVRYFCLPLVCSASTHLACGTRVKVSEFGCRDGINHLPAHMLNPFIITQR